MAPRISLCMIVRDEEAHLRRCLESVQGAVDEIVIVDTGSTDQTVAIAQEYGAVLRQIEWTGDFAAARNVGLELATGDWILCLDADEALHPGSGALLRKAVATAGPEGYYVTIRNLVGPAASPHVQTAFTLRLWRHRPLYRFVGRVHEQILPAILACAPQAQVTNSGVVVIHYGYTQETMTAKAKSERNMRLLRAELERRPEDLFLQFHLGLEYTIQGRHQAACQLFKSVWTRLPVATPWRSKLVKVYGATLLALRRGDQALNLLTAERDRYPDYTDLYFLIGQAHGQRGDHALAAAAFAECLRLGPAPAPPYVDADEEMGTCRAALALGRAQEALGDRAAALAAYRSAANCRPGWLEPLGYLAQLLVSVLDDAALEAELRSFFPAGDSRDLQSLARIFAQVGRYQAALMLVEAAAALGELEPMSRYVRASCLGLLGRFAEALDASAGAWAGTGLTVRVEALRLYASLMMGQPVPPELAERREDEVKALYAEVAELLEGAPPASFQARIGFLPRHRLLVAALRRRAAARAHAPG